MGLLPTHRKRAPGKNSILAPVFKEARKSAVEWLMIHNPQGTQPSKEDIERETQKFVQIGMRNGTYGGRKSPAMEALRGYKWASQ